MNLSYLSKLMIGGLVIAGLSLNGCATNRNPPPEVHDNVCDLIKHDRQWYEAAKKSQDRWGTPIAIQKAFVHQESRFVHNARPPRKSVIGILPGRRASSALGYAQALDGTWSDYQQATGNLRARRTNLNDALDFIGWYNSLSKSRNGIALNDPYNLYLAYHEGHGGFRRKTYQKKPWLMSVAKRVEQRSIKYQNQLSQCRLPAQRCFFNRC